jgi:cation diffusion facilitator family transporter
MNEGRNPAPPRVGGMTVRQTSRLTMGVTLLSMSVATALIIAKAVAWRMTGSVSILASLADSGLDLLASTLTFFAVRYAASPPDAEHRYGHGKAEAFASLMQGALVLVSAALVAREAVGRLLRPHPLVDEAWAVGVMLLSLALTSALIVAQTRVLKRTGSVAVAGDRAHYLADLASNLVVLVGVAGAVAFDAAWLDAAAAAVVAVWLAWTARNVFREATRHLMDQELDDDAREEIRQLMLADPGVIGVHQFRTRAAGPTLHIQAHMDLDPTLSLMDAHAIVDRVERRIREVYPAADVIVHPDPHGQSEDHEREFDVPAGAGGSRL